MQIGAIKMFADGALGRRTGLLSEPYYDAPGEFGEAMHDQATFYEMVKEVRNHMMPIAMHFQCTFNEGVFHLKGIRLSL
ncbi:amidohydrolase family protein [Peribacillus butanolivorans]|nr:amidohydrolase family protein [Peribacillus butanolivorans]